MFSTINDVTRLIYTRGMFICSSSYYYKYNRYESNKIFSNAQNIKHPWIKYSFRAHIIYQNLYLSIFLLMLNVAYYLLWIIVYFRASFLHSNRRLSKNNLANQHQQRKRLLWFRHFKFVTQPLYFWYSFEIFFDLKWGN